MFDIIMELIEGKDMSRYIWDCGAPKFTQLPYMQQIGRQILLGIKYLHENYIVHQNIKPSNIMFDKHYKNIKIISLGMAKKLAYNVKGKVTSQLKGSPRYLSPEQLINQICTYKNDIWSFGCVMLQFCTGLPPFWKLKDEACWM